MLRARRRGFLRSHYDITADDAPLTVFTGERREGCAFELSGAEYRIEREARRRFVLLGPEGRLAVAEQETGRKWRVTAQSGNLQLVRPSIWRSAWEVHQRGSAQGTIRGEGFWGRTVAADIPADVPRPVALFTLYVMLMIFARAAAAAAAG